MDGSIFSVGVVSGSQKEDFGRIKAWFLLKKDFIVI